MNREYQAIYRIGSGAVQSLNIIAPDEQSVQSALEGAKDILVLGVTEIRAVVDWDKPVWDLEEFAAAMSIRGGTLSGKKANGTIPWSSVVNGVSRRVAMKYIEDTLNPIGKSIAQELDRAA